MSKRDPFGDFRPPVTPPFGPPETEHTDYAVCPYCGYEERDSWEINLGPGIEGDGDASCASCGKDFRVWRHCSVSYSTRKMEAP